MTTPAAPTVLPEVGFIRQAQLVPAIVPFSNATLWRKVKDVSGSDSVELAAPFDSTARFRYYVLSADTAQDSPPGALNTLRGFELRLNAQSELPTPGRTTPSMIKSTTAVFFQNRIT